MKVHPQTIYSGKQPEFVVLPFKEYKKLINTVQDYEDIEEVRDFLDSDEEVFPMKIAISLSEGQNKIKTFRLYRKNTQAELADKVGVSKQYISQLENNTRSGSIKILKSIAKILDVDLDDLM